MSNYERIIVRRSTVTIYWRNGLMDRLSVENFLSLLPVK